MKRRAWRHHPASELRFETDVPGARYFAVALDRCMLTYFEVEPGARFPEHRHDSEQITLVLTGRLRFVVEGEEVVVGPGEAIALPGDVRHEVECLGEPVTAVDAWSPVRERYARREPRR